MTTTSTSEHEIRIWHVLRTTDGWLTSADVAVQAHVAGRTARHHLNRLSRAGIVEATPLHNGWRYRLTDPGGSYTTRMAHLAAVMGV